MIERFSVEVWRANDADTENPIRVRAVIEGVPYFGRGPYLGAAFTQFVEVLRDHGVPVAGMTWEPR